ncbi:MAG: oligosaccharide flippase family protein [Candidatus Thermoplasmatota archaeon]|nr:oligosaccharide flippase family protein [Candidatus Thermoplasmatota archaeon]
MSLQKKSIHDSMKLFSAQAITIIFGIIYLFITTLLFSKVDMAALPVFNILVGLCSMVTGFGLSTTCLQKAPEFFARGDKKRGSSLIKISIVIPLLFSFLFAFMIFILSDQISILFFKTPGYSNLIKIMSIGIIPFKLNESLLLATQATDKFGKLSIIRSINGIIIPVISISLFSITGIQGYIIGFIVGQLLSSLIVIFFIREFLLGGSAFFSLRETMSYSVPYYGEGYVRYGMDADQFLVGIFLSPEILATYYIAKTFFNYISQYISTLLDPIIPKISILKSRGEPSLQKAFTMVSRYFSLTFIPVCFLIATLSYPLLQIFGNGKYIDAASVLVIFSISGIFYGFYSIYGNNVYILGKPFYRLSQGIVYAGLNIIIALALVGPLGIIGCAFARFLSLFFAMLFSMYLLKKIIQTKFDVSALKIAIIASIVMSGIILLGQIINHNIIVISIYAIIGCIVYIIIICRNLEIKDIYLLKEVLPKKFSSAINVIDIFRKKKPTLDSTNS